jgi:hypothetical protein
VILEPFEVDEPVKFAKELKDVKERFLAGRVNTYSEHAGFKA